MGWSGEWRYLWKKKTRAASRVDHQYLNINIICVLIRNTPVKSVRLQHQIIHPHLIILLIIKKREKRERPGDETATSLITLLMATGASHQFRHLAPSLLINHYPPPPFLLFIQSLLCHHRSLSHSRQNQTKPNEKWTKWRLRGAPCFYRQRLSILRLQVPTTFPCFSTPPRLYHFLLLTISLIYNMWFSHASPFLNSLVDLNVLL